MQEWKIPNLKVCFCCNYSINSLPALCIIASEIMRIVNKSLTIAIIGLLFLGACKSSEPPGQIEPVQEVVSIPPEEPEISQLEEKDFLEIYTGYVKNVTAVSATIGGGVQSGDLQKVLFMGIVWADYMNPTVERNQGYTTYPRGNRTIESQLSGLKSENLYYARAYATTDKGTFYGNVISFRTPGIVLSNNTVKDAEGNEYPYVIIGGQRWMAANLRTFIFANGDSIPTGLSDYNWAFTNSGACDVYPYDLVEGINSREQMLEIYGALYNWRTVADPRGICPDGWRIPSHDDFTRLERFIEGSQDGLSGFPYNVESTGWFGEAEGDKLKSIPGNHPFEHPLWDPSDIPGGTDDFGFHAVAAGRRHYNGNFERLGHSTYFWSSSMKSSAYVWYRALEFDHSKIGRQGALLRFGFSVRCIQDIEE